MRTSSWVSAAALAVLALADPLRAQPPAPVVIAGSATMKPILETLARLFEKRNPGLRVRITSRGSTDGVAQVINGEAELGACARDLTDAEREAHPGLVTRPIGLDGIAVVVNRKNGVDGISSRQLRDVYLGRITRWDQLGGADAPIRVVVLRCGHATFDAFLSHLQLESETTRHGQVLRAVGAKTTTTARVLLVEDSFEAIGAVDADEEAIGFAPIPFAHRASRNKRIKPLDLDGVPATGTNVLQGTYPMRRPLNLVMLGAPTAHAKTFAELIGSPAGQALVERLDFVPLPPAPPAK